MNAFPPLDQLKAEIDTTLTLGHGNHINICYTLYKIVCRANPTDKAPLLRHAAENFDNAESSREIDIDSFINETEEKQLQKKFGEIADQMLELLLADNPTEDEFYKSLIEIVENPLFREEKTRAFVFYNYLNDKRIPYFQLAAGLKMTDEDWKATNKRLAGKKAKIRFILHANFKQRSERADLLLKELDAIERYEERVCLLGYAVHEAGDGTDALGMLQSLAKIAGR